MQITCPHCEKEITDQDLKEHTNRAFFKTIHKHEIRALHRSHEIINAIGGYLFFAGAITLVLLSTFNQITRSRFDDLFGGFVVISAIILWFNIYLRNRADKKENLLFKRFKESPPTA